VAVGVAVGATVGVAVGMAVGVAVGATVGVAVGATVGVAVGAAVGVAVGAAVGVAVGVAVGASVGAAVGVAVTVCVAARTAQAQVHMCLRVSVLVTPARKIKACAKHRSDLSKVNLISSVRNFGGQFVLRSLMKSAAIAYAPERGAPGLRLNKFLC
jgi:hypothetical protein